MNKYEIIQKIEDFAPLPTQEKWDCSGFAVETEKSEIQKVMLCLTVTGDVICQAKTQNCDMIISHHPLFKIDCHSELVSKSFKPLIDVYCAHTNLDKAKGGTTDTLIETICLHPLLERKELLSEQRELSNSDEGFVRYINYETSVKDYGNRKAHRGCS